MAITDLTGYTWYGNETVDVSTVHNYFINFINDNIECNEFSIIHATGSIWGLRYYKVEGGFVGPYLNTSGWKSESSRTIQITGGTGATNAELISWFEANGTLTPTITEDPDYLIKESTLTNIADAIRSKTGDSDELNPVDMPEAIESIETGITPTGNIQLTQQSGTDVTNYATASVRGASVALNTPTVNSSGLVTASATVPTTGWINSAPANKTLQLTTQAGKTVTPSASSQTAVASGRYTTGAVTVAAVPSETKTVALSMASGNQTVNASSGKWMTSVTVQKPATMLPENIKKDVNIGGVVGTMEAGEDLTALNTEINELDGTTGTKSVAQMTTAVSNANDEVDDQSALIEQIQTALQSKSGGGGGEDDYIELPPVSEWESTTLRLETDNAKYKISSNYTLPEGYLLYIIGYNNELHIKDDTEFIINGNVYGFPFIYNNGIIEGSASFLAVPYLKNKGIVNATFNTINTVDNYGYMISSPMIGQFDSIHINYGRIDINSNCEFNGHITNNGYIFMKASADIGLYGTIDNTNNGIIELTDNAEFNNYGQIINTNNDKHGYINVFSDASFINNDGTVINTTPTYIKNIGAHNISDDIPHVNYELP